MYIYIYVCIYMYKYIYISKKNKRGYNAYNFLYYIILLYKRNYSQKENGNEIYNKLTLFPKYFFDSDFNHKKVLQNVCCKVSPM
jgi:hypothetical protein